MSVTAGMLRRSLLTALLVGLLLFAINQGARALGPWDLDLALRLVATMLVPFVVSLVSAVFTRRELERGRLGAAPASGWDTTRTRA